MQHSMSKDTAFNAETTPRHTFLCSDSQCLPPGDPRILCAKHGYPITGKSFIAVISFDLVRLIEYFCCNTGRLHYFFLRRRRTRSGKTSEKVPVTAERLAQMFGVSHTADYCNWADVSFQVFLRGMHVTTMEELVNTKTPKMFSVKAFYWNL